MLRFNTKEHNLEELKKYHFVEEELMGANCYGYHCIPYSVYINCNNGMVIAYFHTTQKYDWENLDCNYSDLTPIPDLIKDGLVIKERK